MIINRNTQGGYASHGCSSLYVFFAYVIVLVSACAHTCARGQKPTSLQVHSYSDCACFHVLRLIISGWTPIRLFFCPPPFQPSQCWVQIVVVMLFCSMLEINDVVLYCIIKSSMYPILSSSSIRCRTPASSLSTTHSSSGCLST